ncbi:hypothetical protein NDA16_002866 [Ustilago loliicola]|nr:hypothetical protein NDA16_002866 [Ustilago loliicola]
MLHHLPRSMHHDPFHFSSSPERLAARPYVATRPNPYTVKSQNTLYTSLRSTAQPLPIDPQLTSPTFTPASHQSRSVESLYSSLEAATRSPRCSSKPQLSPEKRYPLLTMVKSKPRPVKAMALSAEIAAAKRLSSVKPASAAAEKRHRNGLQSAKQNTKNTVVANVTDPHSKIRTRYGSPALASSPTSPTPVRRAAPSEQILHVPRITIRPPTPEPEPCLDRLLKRKADDSVDQDDSAALLYSSTLLKDLAADLSKVEDAIDEILGKYLDVRKCARPLNIELLRYLTTSICKLYSFVEDPESELGLAKFRAISSQLFRHTITGFFHLLDDTLAPYATASSLALVSAKILQDFDKATAFCCRLVNVSRHAQQRLKHGQVFLRVLNEELDKILDRGLALTDMRNKLTLPGRGPPSFPAELADETTDGDADPSSSAGLSTWERRAQWIKQRAQQGDQRDQFVGIDVVRYIGELALHKVVGASVLSKWLDRFLTRTVHLEIPSAWEIECACALLITVGEMLDRKPQPNEDSLSASVPAGQETGSARAASCSQNSRGTDKANATSMTEDGEGLKCLQKAMDRIDFLVTQAEISESAREWLVEVQQLRQHGWARGWDSDSIDDYLSSD